MRVLLQKLWYIFCLYNILPHSFMRQNRDVYFSYLSQYTFVNSTHRKLVNKTCEVWECGKVHFSVNYCSRWERRQRRRFERLSAIKENLYNTTKLKSELLVFLSLLCNKRQKTPASWRVTNTTLCFTLPSLGAGRRRQFLSFQHRTIRQSKGRSYCKLVGNSQCSQD